MESSLESIIALDREFLYQNNSRFPVSFTHGKGEYLYGTDGREYIDFFSGIAVSALGHAHPALTGALHAQIDRMIHTSNWYFNAEQAEAARLISKTSFKGRTFFANSGTEANEAALKLARKYGKTIASDKNGVISFSGSFHGRTYGSLSATGNEKIKAGFDPLLPGITILPFNEIEPFKKAVSASTCAVILELIQGEGGIIVADKEFINVIIEECRKHKALLIIDEIQTGVGRTGKSYAYQQYGIQPDIITLAKGLGGGIPVGVLHTTEELHTLFNAGGHGTTFGGNHLASVAVTAILTELEKPSFNEYVMECSKLFFDRLGSIKEKSPVIKEVRGMGLHIGIELNVPGLDIVKKALSSGLLINCTHDTVLRIMPPLIISRDAVNRGLDIFESIITKE